MVKNDFAQNIINKLNIIIEKANSILEKVNNNSSSSNGISKSYYSIVSSNELATISSGASAALIGSVASVSDRQVGRVSRVINFSGTVQVSITGFCNDYSGNSNGQKGKFNIIVNNDIVQSITIDSETSKTYAANISVVSGDNISVSILPSYYYKGGNSEWRVSAWTISSIKVLGTILEGNISPHMT